MSNSNRYIKFKRSDFKLFNKIFNIRVLDTDTGKEHINSDSKIIPRCLFSVGIVVLKSTRSQEKARSHSMAFDRGLLGSRIL